MALAIVFSTLVIAVEVELVDPQVNLMLPHSVPGSRQLAASAAVSRTSVTGSVMALHVVPEVGVTWVSWNAARVPQDESR